jgi:hypothetical protein
MDILSGHGVTTKGPHSDVSLEVKNFTQALRQHDSFGDPSARGILAIVDRFVDLKYFQSIDEIRDYIIIVGKVSDLCYCTFFRAQKKADMMRRKYCPTAKCLQKSAKLFIRPQT